MKILVTRQLPFDVQAAFKDYELIYNNEDKPLSHKKLNELIVDVDGVISMLSDSINMEVINKAKKLKVIANYAVGYNNLDITSAQQRDIKVFNTPDVLTETTAELGFSLMMAVARRLVESDTYTRSGAFEGWGPSLFLGNDLYGKTLGIYGFGRIGQAVARCASGFNMKVIYSGRSRKFNEELLLGAKKVSFENMLEQSDFILVAAPLTEDTRYRFGYKEFSKMKKNTIFVNIGRGPIVNESELAKALKENLIFGAGLDVFEDEPEINSDLFELDNIIMLPHIGSSSFSTRAKMAELCIDSVKSTLKGDISHLPNNIC